MYVKDLNQTKFQFLIKKREDVGIKYLNNSNIFIEYSKHRDDVYNNINDCNTNTSVKTLIVFDDMIADIMTNKKFFVPKEAKLNSTHYLIMKIHNKRELQKIATNHSADIDHKDFMKIYRKCTSQPYYLTIDTFNNNTIILLTIDTALPANNSLRYRKNIVDLL